jgi:hypothetical protein
MSLQAFERVAVACTSDHVDHGLLEYAALLSSGDSPATVLVAATPAERVLRSLTPEARGIFQRRGVTSLAFQPLLESDLDAVLSAARDFQADLLVVRHPSVYRDDRLMGKRLLKESPCSICCIPRECAPVIERVALGVDMSPEGASLITQATRLCRQIQADELFVVHSYFLDSAIEDEQLDKELRDRKLLELYGFIARSRAGTVKTTPLLEQSARYDRAVLRAAVRESADLVVIGRSPLPRLPVPSPPSKSELLLRDCDVPLLQLKVTAQKPTILEILQKRLFSQPEPAFN